MKWQTMFWTMKAQSCKEIILPKLIYKLNKIPIKI